MIRYLLILFLISTISYAQLNSLNISGGLGFGEIKGNSPMHTTLDGKLNIETKFPFADPVGFRFSFLYAQKYEKFVPGEYKDKYFPFIKSASLMATLDQPLQNNFFLKEGIGYLIINDRTFSDIDVWAHGIGFYISGNIDFREEKSKGFTIGLAAEYGITFTNTTPRYYTFMFQTEYYLF